jgi:hypothetical protein
VLIILSSLVAVAVVVVQPDHLDLVVVVELVAIGHRQALQSLDLLP